MKNHLRAIAAGLGLPYELVSGDLEGVTYSSIRAGLIEFRRRVEQLQHNVVVHLFCRPVWERFVRLAVLTAICPRGTSTGTRMPTSAANGCRQSSTTSIR